MACGNWVIWWNSENWSGDNYSNKWINISLTNAIASPDPRCGHRRYKIGWNGKRIARDIKFFCEMQRRFPGELEEIIEQFGLIQPPMEDE